MPRFDKYAVFERDNFTCAYCGRKLWPNECQLDHIIPVSKGGADHPYNSATACRDCNLAKKGLLLPGELLFEFFGHDKNRFEYITGLRDLAVSTMDDLCNVIYKTSSAWLQELYFCNFDLDLNIREILRGTGIPFRFNDPCDANLAYEHETYYKRYRAKWRAVFLAEKTAQYNIPF